MKSKTREKNRLKLEYGRFVIQEDPELSIYSVRYLGDYEALVESDLVEKIAIESKKRKELIAMILGTTKIIRNLTPGSPDKVSNQLIIASICELLDAGISPLEITTQFFDNMTWCKIEKILKNPNDSERLFIKYSKSI